MWPCVSTENKNNHQAQLVEELWMVIFIHYFHASSIFWTKNPSLQANLSESIIHAVKVFRWKKELVEGLGAAERI